MVRQLFSPYFFISFCILVYWGVTPVTSERSKSYWEMKNNVIFPKGFEATLEWSVDFAKKVKEFADVHGDNLYLMPIKGNLEGYLSGVLGNK